MRSHAVALGLTLVAAGAFSGCAAEPDYAAICVDPETQERVDDDDCDDDQADYHGGGGGHGGGFYWFYMSTHSNHSVPAVGSTYNPSHGTYRGSTLGSNVARGGLPSTGSSSVKSYVKSGGFGGRSGGFSS